MDLISRQAAIDAIMSYANARTFNSYYAGMSKARDIIEKLPSAQPEQHYDEWCGSCKEYNQEKHCCPRWNRVIKSTVEELKTAQPEPQWIPCSERLPEDDDYKPFSFYEDGAVLYSTASGNVGFGWYYESTKEWANEDDNYPGEVIAWMPPPEPYQPEEQE